MNGKTSSNFLPKTFRGGGYEVTINADRSVRVKPGDWLSKYSMAIYGNFNHIDKFWRKNGAGYQTIINKDLIRVGETLYHPDLLPGEPSHPGINPPVGVPPSDGETPLRPENLARFLEWFKSRFVKTDWRVTETGSGGADLSFSFLTGQYQTICIEHEDAKAANWFHAIAGGLTIGWPSEGFTAGGSFSTIHFPSAGTILRAIYRRKLTLRDFRHGILVLELSAGFVVGGALTLVIFGVQFPAILLMAIADSFRNFSLPALQYAFNRTAPAGCVVLLGSNLAIPGANAAARVGFMYDRDYFGI